MALWRGTGLTPRQTIAPHPLNCIPDQRMAEFDDLARQLSALSPRQLATVLNRARSIRRVDPTNVVADWGEISDFVACPFCGQRIDSNCVDYRLFLTLISDAYARGANSVFLSCEGNKVIVAYDTFQCEPRDKVPARHWHQLHAGIHLALARHAIYDSVESTQGQNLLPIADRVADFDELRRVALASHRPIPSGLRIKCADSLTSLHFEV